MVNFSARSPSRLDSDKDTIQDNGAPVNEGVDLAEDGRRRLIEVRPEAGKMDRGKAAQFRPGSG